MASKKSPASKSPRRYQKQSDDGPTDEERQQEASKTAQAALAAQEKSKELTQAAAGAGDPEERQRLLNEALEKEMEAGNLGKTAKYLTSGSFQGLVAGTGIGTAVGGGLGTLTGALTGGLMSLVTGGVGAGVGALHGPFLKMGDVAGGAVRKITGTIPGWEATPEQQKALEKMLGQANDQERPSEEDLSAMKDPSKIKVKPADNTEDTYSGRNNEDDSWTAHASSYIPSKDSLPSMPGWASSKDDAPAQTAPGDNDKSRTNKLQDSNDSDKDAVQEPSVAKEKISKDQGPDTAPLQSDKVTEKAERKRPRKLNADSQSSTPARKSRSQNDNTKGYEARSNQQNASTTTDPTRKKPRKLGQSAKIEDSSREDAAGRLKKKPRKLEVRSGK